MYVEQLQVGDWVQIKIAHVDFEKITRVGEVGKGWLVDEDGENWAPYVVLPIPLTAEILTGNLFSFESKTMFDDEIYRRGDVEVVVVPSMDRVRQVNIKHGCEFMMKRLGDYYFSVHELQHMLRLTKSKIEINF